MFFKTKIAALEKANADLRAQLAALGDDPAAALSTLTTERDTARNEAAAYLETINGLRADIDQLKAAAETVEVKAGRKAVEIASSVSVPPVGADPKASGNDPAGAGGDILAQYRAITDPDARLAFFEKNKAAIFAARARVG